MNFWQSLPESVKKDYHEIESGPLSIVMENGAREKKVTFINIGNRTLFCMATSEGKELLASITIGEGNYSAVIFAEATIDDLFFVPNFRAKLKLYEDVPIVLDDKCPAPHFPKELFFVTDYGLGEEYLRNVKIGGATFTSSIKNFWGEVYKCQLKMNEGACIAEKNVDAELQDTTSFKFDRIGIFNFNSKVLILKNGTVVAFSK